MANLIVREFEPKDDAGFRHVRAMVYRNGEPVKPEDTILPEDCIGYVGELDGEIVCAATVIDMTATRGEATLRCAAIAAVGVLPERRRGGYGGQLMAEMTTLLREKGIAIASLYPFRASFYNKYGYMHSGKRFEISCPSDRLPKFDSELDPVELKGEDRQRIFPCYDQFANRYSGMNRRNELQWMRILGRDNPFAVYAVGDPVEAYAVLRINSDFWEKQTIKEFAWSTGRGYRSMLSFFRSLGINKTHIEWNEPGDSPFLGFHLEQGAAVKLDRSIMFRLINVQEALRNLVCEVPGEFCLKVHDPHEPLNVGPWQVCFGLDGTQVKRTVAEPDFEIGIGHLTQAFFGEPSLEQIEREGLLLNGSHANRKVGVEAAIRFFGHANAYCMDFF
jgi:predicted acetyltransferase